MTAPDRTVILMEHGPSLCVSQREFVQSQTSITVHMLNGPNPDRPQVGRSFQTKLFVGANLPS